MDTKLTLPPKTTPSSEGLSQLVTWCDVDNLVYYTLDVLSLSESKSWVRINEFTTAPKWMAFPVSICKISREIHCRVSREDFVGMLHQGLDEEGELTLTIDNEFHLQLEVGLATWCITCA